MKKEITKTQETMNGNEYEQVGTVYQATMGYHHFGMWTSESEALAHIKANYPSAKKFDGYWNGLEKLPEDTYFIQPRTLFTLKK